MRSYVVRMLRWLGMGTGSGRATPERCMRPASHALKLEALEPRLLLSAKLFAAVDAAVNHHAVAAPAVDDKSEDNDTFAKARDLTLDKDGSMFVDRILADDDWYKFKIDRTGDQNDFVQLGFKHSQGDIDMTLHDSRGTQLAIAGSQLNNEFISLSGRPAGTYYIKVYGYNGATNPSYDISIAPPTASDAKHTLFVNFDGVFLSRTDLNRWANGQWLDGLLAAWDTGNDGINVGEFLAGRPDREKVISGIIKNLNSDLQAFGIQAVRHFGLAWESAFATTLFVGPHVMDNGNNHVASDFDYQNVNLTDVGFVGDESGGWSKVDDLIKATSDVALHEAGHTFGLYHVASGTDKETMGLRYNTPQAQWAENTAYLNKTYGLLGATDGAIQNSYTYMRQWFVNGGVANPAAAAPFATLADMNCTANPSLHDHDLHPAFHEFATSNLSLNDAVGDIAAVAAQPSTAWLEFVQVGSPAGLAFDAMSDDVFTRGNDVFARGGVKRGRARCDDSHRSAARCNVVEWVVPASIGGHNSPYRIRSNRQPLTK